MNRIAKSAVLSLVVVLALSGCLRYNMDITLSSDDTVSGTVITAIQSGVGEQMGVDSDEEALAELFADSPFDTESGKFSVSDYAEDDYVGKLYSFDGLDLDQFGVSFAELFNVERVGDQFVVSSDAAPANADQIDQIPTGAESMLSITFPGEVTDHNGTLDGKTVTWDLFAQTEPLSATADATSSGGSFPMWLVVVALGILAVLIGVAVVVVLVVRKNKGPAPTTMPAPPAPPAPTAIMPDQDPAAPPAPPAPPAPVAPDAPPAPPAPPEGKQE